MRYSVRLIVIIGLLALFASGARADSDPLQEFKDDCDKISQQDERQAEHDNAIMEGACMQKSADYMANAGHGIDCDSCNDTDR